MLHCIQMKPTKGFTLTPLPQLVNLTANRGVIEEVLNVAIGLLYEKTAWPLARYMASILEQYRITGI
jgi:hypothetical protein